MEPFIFLIYSCGEFTPISPVKSLMESGYGVPLDYRDLELKRIFGNVLFLRSTFTKLLEGTFFFLDANQNRKLFYKTLGDALSNLSLVFTTY